MDNFFISNLEFIMDRSPISPYAWARFLLSSSMLWWIYEHLKKINSYDHTTIFNLVVLFVVYILLYRKTKNPEHRNNKQYSNFLKERDQLTRNLSQILLLICFVVAKTNGGEFVDLFFEVLVWTIYLYLISIEWNRPSKNSLGKRRWIGARLIRKTKNSNFLRRKNY